jgi:hypothetical protein
MNDRWDDQIGDPGADESVQGFSRAGARLAMVLNEALGAM